MGRSSRFVGMLLALVVIFTAVLPAAAANEYIDASTASSGYFTVYAPNEGVRMKVGLTYAGATFYNEYAPGTEGVFSFDKGDGNYTITLFANVSGTSYRTVLTQEVYVQIASANSQYLVSTNEISFSETDAVGLKAAELSQGKTVYGKAIAFYNYIATNFTYDYDFAAMVNNGQITNYTPDTESVLANKTGVCYDFAALFAAMCRSQDIPCVITKGYLDGQYHAWNKICIDGSWYAIDLTYAVGQGVSVTWFNQCITPLTGYVASSDSISLAA